MDLTKVPRPCPNCAGTQFRQFLSAEVIRMEMLLRAQFVFDRVSATPSREQRKDLTDFAQSEVTPLLECMSCCALLRAHAEQPLANYADDRYDPQAMEALLPRYIAAFRAREQPYRALLPPHAEVLEVGPHLGAFLRVATDWGWRARGVDVGKDTTRFVNAHGLTTYNKTIEECRFPAASFDGVFIWNCIEQLPDPHATLAETRRVLKPGGALVLRTPNALLYRECRKYLDDALDTPLATAITRTLGYNNLLAWPYLYGYDGTHLEQLAGRHGFTRHAGLNSELIAIPFPDLDPAILAEKDAAAATLRGWSALGRHAAAGRLTGPWIEIVFR